MIEKTPPIFGIGNQPPKHNGEEKPKDEKPEKSFEEILKEIAQKDRGYNRDLLVQEKFKEKEE